MDRTTFVADYFDSVAAHYRMKPGLTPSHWIRNVETRAVTRKLGNLSGKSVLEVGCGRGHYTRLMAALDLKDLTVVDLSHQMLNGISDLPAHKVHGDFIQWEPPRKFDFILCAGTLEFMDDPQAFFHKARVVSRDSGTRLLLLCPRSTWMGRAYRAFHRRHGFLISLFSGEDLTALATAADWKLRTMEHVHPYAMLAEFS